MITITDAARDKILGFIDDNPQLRGNTHTCLTLGVVGGGCSGFQYVMNVEERDEDEVARAKEINGIRVYIDPKSLLYLAGATVDYINGLMQSGFKIDNPNSTRTCSCGQSFR